MPRKAARSNKKKYKNKLQKLIEEHTDKYHEPFEPTYKDCERWFHILNRELFGRALPLIPFDIRRRALAHAYYDYEEKDINLEKSRFLMNHRYRNKLLFVEILAHEMVHHWQYIFEGKVHHGQSFYQWKPIFERKNLALKEIY